MSLQLCDNMIQTEYAFSIPDRLLTSFAVMNIFHGKSVPIPNR